MLSHLAGNSCEYEREKRRAEEPLNAAYINRSKVVDEAVADYHREVTCKEHYVQKQAVELWRKA